MKKSEVLLIAAVIIIVLLFLFDLRPKKLELTIFMVRDYSVGDATVSIIHNTHVSVDNVIGGCNTFGDNNLIQNTTGSV